MARKYVKDNDDLYKLLDINLERASRMIKPIKKQLTLLAI